MSLILIGILGTILLWVVILKILDRKPKSDVPVVYKIGWDRGPQDIETKKLDVHLPGGNVRGLLSEPTIAEYQLQGTIRGASKSRPKIGKVHISERWLFLPSQETQMIPGNEPKAEVLLTPVLEWEEDKKYSGEAIEFNITVRDFIATAGWGRNLYTAVAGLHRFNFEISQRK